MGHPDMRMVTRSSGTRFRRVGEICDDQYSSRIQCRGSILKVIYTKNYVVDQGC
ncbi:hypothetical protein DPMN_005175 [Dreissena polymorpha]|uniref:Uncharacterized protein n=1 Tax=Dreissena polymorpha TaxID=45954 RepID=A0A9D4RTM9_DREPO|nr:hypothetical protein DPMN_005175 [Dreissena polymorpha]